MKRGGPSHQFLMSPGGQFTMSPNKRGPPGIAGQPRSSPSSRGTSPAPTVVRAIDRGFTPGGTSGRCSFAPTDAIHPLSLGR